MRRGLCILLQYLPMDTGLLQPQFKDPKNNMKISVRGLTLITIRKLYSDRGR